MLGDVRVVDYGYEDRLITRLDLRAIVAKSLTDRQRRILHSRIHGSTLREIGKSDGVSPERVRQIYDKAIRRLKFKVTGKRDEYQDTTKSFLDILREHTPPAEVAPQVIPPPAPMPWLPWFRPTDAPTLTAEGNYIWKDSSPPLRQRNSNPVIPPQPIPWSPGPLERDRIIISVYWTPGGLIRRHHTESAAYAADMRDMMKIGDRIEVLADGICTKLVLRGDKWRLIDPSP